MTPPRVLIAGGGYVGMYAALALERALQPEEADLCLVAPENFMCYQPLLPEVAAGSVEPRHVVVPLRRVLRRTTVTLGALRGLDHRRRRASVTVATGEVTEVPYDIVVLGLGAVTRVLDVPGLVEKAVGFQTLTEAIHLRNQILSALETAESAADPDARRSALTFVFVGGGYAGVEALAELRELAVAAAASYRSVTPQDMRWILLEATDRILPSMDERLARAAADQLRARGIEIRLETVLESVSDDGRLRLSDGGELRAGTLVWMPGVTANPVAAQLGLRCDDQGRLVVDRCLRVDGDGAAWAAGDCAAVPAPDGSLYPPTAQHAEREARHLAANVVRALRGQEPAPFTYRSRGEFVTLGGRRAVARLLVLRLHGVAAWALRRAYYLARMPTADRRLRLAIDWTVGLAFPPDTAQLGAAQHPDRPLAEAARTE